jgi:phosphate-selective porin
MQLIKHKILYIRMDFIKLREVKEENRRKQVGSRGDSHFLGLNAYPKDGGGIFHRNAC